MMMKKTLLYVVLIIAASGCSDERIKGSGDIVTEVRNVGSFDRVSSSGSSNVYIQYGKDYKVELRGSDNLIPRFRTNLQNGTIILGYASTNVINDDISVYLTVPAIKKVKQSGSADIKIKGEFPAQNEFSFESSGSGNITVIDEFSANRVAVDVSGSSKIDLKKVKSNDAEVNISGSALTYLSVQDELKVKISGSGKVYYKGSPEISSKISGSGEIVKLRDE